MLCSLYLIFVLNLLRLVVGDVSVVNPEKGSTFSGSSGTVTIEVKWMDNGGSPQISDISSYTFTLNYGPNNAIAAVKTIIKGVSPKDVTDSDGVYAYTVSFPSSVCGNGQFYIQVYAVVTGQGSTINYSPRFTLTSMGGATTFTYTDSAQPNGQTALQASSSATIDTKSFTLLYTQQTGISRFAPMQMQPNSKITATAWTRQYASSAVTYYSTFRTSLDQATTITPGWSYTLPSGINRATPAAYPSANGGWYDAKEKQTLSTRKINLSNRLTGSSSSSESSSSSGSSSSA